MIDLLNGCFVPVLARTSDYEDEGGTAPAAEKKAYIRVLEEAQKAKLPVGGVHVYLVAPDGKVVDSMPNFDAAKPKLLIDRLQRTVAALHVRKGEPLVKPTPQSVAPAHAPDALVLHLTARYLQPKGNDFVPVEVEKLLGQERVAAWASLPSEDWIVLGRKEWTKLLPAGAVRVSSSWDLDKDVMAKVLIHFFPPTENTDVATNHIDRQSLKATVVSMRDGVARLRIDGGLKMKHPFVYAEDDEVVEANVVGYLDFETGKKRVRSLRLATAQASYRGKRVSGGSQPFGVAVKSAP